MNAPANVTFDKTKFDWWKAALAGNRAAIHDGEPMTGYYRSKFKNKQTGEETLYAVAFWYLRDGSIACQVNDRRLQGDQLERAIANWPYISNNPVQYEAWCGVVKEGKPWPDQHVIEKAAPAEASNQPLDAGKSEPSVAGAADQSKPAEELTPEAYLKQQIDRTKLGIARYAKKSEDGKTTINLVDSDEVAGAAQSLRDTLLKLSAKAKKAREDANRPHQEAIRANGAIWNPLEQAAKDGADFIRDNPLKAWEKHKRDQLAAAQTAALAAQADAVGGGYSSGVPFEPQSNAPAPAAKIKGATGRAASVQEIEIAVIEDQDAVYRHFQNDAQLKAVLQGLANGAVRAGIKVHGVKIEKDVNIR